MSARAGALLRRVVAVRDDEVAALLWSCAYGFAVLASFYVLRPLREEMGVAGGIKNLPWMFTGTLAAMLATSPLFSMLVSRFSRRRFIPYAYHFFTANLVIFFALFRLLHGDGRLAAARAFYVWTSVFNLFVVAVFWGYMADVFRSEQGKRLFGFIAAGGTLGGIAGSGFTASAVSLVGSAHLPLVAAVLVEGAVLAFHRLDRLPVAAPPGGPAPPSQPAPNAAGGRAAAGLAKTGAWGGLTLVLGSGYLLMIALYMLLFTTSSTFAYMEQARIVAAASSSPEARTAIFARIDLLVNILSLVVQGLLTGRILRAIGVGSTLTILPVVNLAGFGALLAWPAVGVLSAFQVLRRGSDYSLAKPAREVLYTVLDREEKYKAKSFIDTFVYRSGDTIGAWAYKLVVAGGDPAARVLMASLPITAAWLAVCAWLGGRQKRRAEERADLPLPQAS